MSAAILAAGGGLSRTATFITWRLSEVVYSAPLSAAVTGNVYTKKDNSLRFLKLKKGSVKFDMIWLLIIKDIFKISITI